MHELPPSGLYRKSPNCVWEREFYEVEEVSPSEKQLT